MVCVCLNQKLDVVEGKDSVCVSVKYLAAGALVYIQR